MSLRLPQRDPRTIAREIPGISNVMFPQLTAGVVAYLNKASLSCEGVCAVPDELISKSSLRKSMLFELGYSRAEQIINASEQDWLECFSVAVDRQKKHFDAFVPNKLLDIDIEIAETVARNLNQIIDLVLCPQMSGSIVLSPMIPGFQWIASGVGDFAIGRNLVEVKCTNKNFGSSDYRQVLMYWLLSYAAAIEGNGEEWERIALVNPRLNKIVVQDVDEILGIVTAGRSKLEIYELFASVIGDYASKVMPEFRL